MSNNEATCVNICRECMRRVNEYGYLCKSLLFKACKNYSAGNALAYVADEENEPFDKTQFHLPAKFLESNGYIVTHELTNEIIAIIPNVFKKDMTYEYCWCDKCEEC